MEEFQRMLIFLQLINTDEERDFFEKIYFKYYKKMYAIAFSILHSEMDSEDAVAQVFLYVAENFENFVGGKCPDNASFYYCAVKYRAIDILRKQKKTIQYDVYNINMVVDDFSGISNPKIEILTSAFSKLKPNFQQVLILKYHENLDTVLISKLMNIKRNSAQHLIRRALSALKKEFENEERNFKKQIDRRRYSVCD